MLWQWKQECMMLNYSANLTLLIICCTCRSHTYAKASFRSLQSGEEVKNIEIDNKTQCPIVNILSNRRYDCELWLWVWRIHHLCGCLSVSVLLGLPVEVQYPWLCRLHVYVYGIHIFTVAFSVVVVVRSRECIVVVNAATLLPSFYIKSEYL